MSGKTENLKLSDQQKTRLLSLGLESATSGNTPDPDEERGDLLCDILRCPLPGDGNASDMKGESWTKLPPGFGPSLGDLLRDTGTNIKGFRQIKEYAKALGRTANSDVEKEVFLALYFAAIAAALISHGAKITEHAESDLLRFFSTYANATWIPENILGLFCDAAGRRQKRGEANKGPVE